MGYILTIVGHVQGDVVALDEHILRQILNTGCDKIWYFVNIATTPYSYCIFISQYVFVRFLYSFNLPIMWDIDHHLIKGFERIALHNCDLESIVAVNIYVWTRNDEDVCKKLFAKLIDMWCSVQLMGFIASRKKCTVNVMGGAFSSVYQLWQISVKCFREALKKW